MHFQSENECFLPSRVRYLRVKKGREAGRDVSSREIRGRFLSSSTVIETCSDE